ncbi:hypothetical protein ACX0GZ_13450 [Sphingomonas aestuarii]
MITQTLRHRLLLATALSMAAFAVPAAAQDNIEDENRIIVTAQRENQSGVEQQGSVGVLGDKDAADVPFSIRSYNSADPQPAATDAGAGAGE